MFEPGYLTLSRTGELYQRAVVLESLLEECAVCPHECRINRINGETGICNAPADIILSSAFPHFGEEPPLVGHNGLGTIFFTYCNLQGIFCQNYTISHLGEGKHITTEEFAKTMLSLQSLGCHNINFATPTHYVPQIVRAVAIAAERGLYVPLVYNSSGYDSVETLRYLNGIIDIYMPDMKFPEEASSEKYTQAPDYPDRLFDALKEMHRQVGDLHFNSEGIAERGMLIRHLVMPHDLAKTDIIVQFVAYHLSKNSYINIMGQYYPCFKAGSFSELSRQASEEEIEQACAAARAAGLHRGFLSPPLKLIFITFFLTSNVLIIIF